MNWGKLQNGLLVAIVASPLVLGLFWLFHGNRPAASTVPVAAVFRGEDLGPDFHVDLKSRKVFPFSVVPGGTVNRGEVEATVKSDRVVAEHYKGIQLDRLNALRLKAPASGYVSYRVGNRIYWTSKKQPIQPGEILLTDGSSFIRGRCGNRISFTPVEPVRPASEPTAATLERPVWEGSVFQAMVEQARSGKDALRAEMPPNLRSEVPMRIADAPDSLFAVAPSPRMIGGGLPGGLPGSTDTGGFGVATSGPGTLWAFPVERATTIALPPETVIEAPITLASVFPLTSFAFTERPFSDSPAISIAGAPTIAGGAVFVVQPPYFLSPRDFLPGSSLPITTATLTGNSNASGEPNDPRNPDPPRDPVLPRDPGDPKTPTRPGGFLEPPVEQPGRNNNPMAPVPEPQSVGMVLLGLGLVLAARRRCGR